MYIGIGRYELLIPYSESLKDKRQLVRSVSQAVRNKFNVSIAEVDYQQLWQRAALGVTCAAESLAHCRKVMQEVEKAMSRAAVDGAEIVERSLDFVSLEDL